MSLADLIAAFELPFMSRALLTVTVLAIASGIVGVFVSFRDMEFVTDGLVHAVFPGIAIGYMLGGDSMILPGALLAALVTVVVMTILSNTGKSGSDATIAVVMTSMFSLGVVVVSRSEGYISELESLLFGHLLTVTDTQLVQLSIVAVIAVALIALTWRRQLFRAHDPQGFAAAGFSPLATDLTLGAAIAMLVVAGVQALGNLMVLALLIVPIAAARQFTRRLWLLAPLAIMIALTSGVTGLSISAWASFGHNVNASAGALVVLTMLLLYLVALMVRTTIWAARTHVERATEPRNIRPGVWSS